MQPYARGPGDGLPQLVGAHLPHQDLRAFDGLGEFGVLGAVRVEVAAEAENHLGPVRFFRRCGEERGDEGGAFGLVLAQAEDLLELVDDQQEAFVWLVHQHLLGREPEFRRAAPQFGDGHLGSRGQHACALTQRMRAGPDGQPQPPVHRQPGGQHGRLPGPGRPDHRDDAMSVQPLDDLRHQPVPPEEPAGVTGVKGPQPHIRWFLGGFHLAGVQFFGKLPPFFLPFGGIAIARADVGQRDSETGQLIPTRGGGQRRRRIVRPGPERAITRASGPRPQLPQLDREPLDGASVGIQWSLRPWQTEPPLPLQAPAAGP
nr:hypothetical protein [Amycolatopsis sp. YIM 10]